MLDANLYGYCKDRKRFQKREYYYEWKTQLHGLKYDVRTVGTNPGKNLAFQLLSFVGLLRQYSRVNYLTFSEAFFSNVFVGFDVTHLSIMGDSDVDGQQSVSSLLPDADFETCHKCLCLNVLLV